MMLSRDEPRGSRSGDASRPVYHPDASEGDGPGLWALAFGVVLAFHLGAAAWLLSPHEEARDGNPDGDAITVDLVPIPPEQTPYPDDAVGPPVEQPAAPTSDKALADDPTPPAPEPSPSADVRPERDRPPLASPPSPSPEAVLQPSTAADPRKAEETKPDPTTRETMPDARKDDAPRHTVPSQASEGSAALLGGSRRPSVVGQATWQGAVGTHLGRNRRYPQEARDRGQQGTAKVRVTVDVNGHVIGCTLVQSSGYALLDREALALMRRADPFPKPPVGLPAPIILTVPVNFAIH